MFVMGNMCTPCALGNKSKKRNCVVTSCSVSHSNNNNDDVPPSKYNKSDDNNVRNNNSDEDNRNSAINNSFRKTSQKSSKRLKLCDTDRNEDVASNSIQVSNNCFFVSRFLFTVNLIICRCRLCILI